MYLTSTSKDLEEEVPLLPILLLKIRYEVRPSLVIIISPILDRMKVSKKTLMYAAAFLAVVVLAYYFAPMWREGFSGGASFTLYYADWCPHCKSIKPVFSEWSSKKTMEVNGKTVSLEMVEADTDKAKVQAANVKGFPTFMLKKADGTSVEFSGDRSPSGWESWLSQNL